MNWTHQPFCTKQSADKILSIASVAIPNHPVINNERTVTNMELIQQLLWPCRGNPKLDCIKQCLCMSKLISKETYGFDHHSMSNQCWYILFRVYCLSCASLNIDFIHKFFLLGLATRKYKELKDWICNPILGGHSFIQCCSAMWLNQCEIGVGDIWM